MISDARISHLWAMSYKPLASSILITATPIILDTRNPAGILSLVSGFRSFWRVAPPTSSFLQALPSGDVPFPAGWIRAQHVAELPRSGASDTFFSARGQRPAPILGPRVKIEPPASPCISAQFLVSPATPPAATLIISIDAPRAGCSSEILPPEANAALEIQKSVFTSSFSYAAQPRAAAQRRRKRLHDLPPESPAPNSSYSRNFAITRTCEPPCSGGRTDYTMYRNPASGLKFSIFCRRRPPPAMASKHHISQNASISHAPVSTPPPRSGGGSDYTAYRNPASRNSLQFHRPRRTRRGFNMPGARALRCGLNSAQPPQHDFLPLEANVASTINTRVPALPDASHRRIAVPRSIMLYIAFLPSGVEIQFVGHSQCFCLSHYQGEEPTSSFALFGSTTAFC
ncbi:hypothetical protein C8R43DRAFT_1179888 [Mycena crocata]|nr:hypothetical protein C8R43DRAFT_1179888 [Mycena crocata]